MRTLAVFPFKIISLAILALFVTGCGSVQVTDANDQSNLVGADGVYTLVNLHPDEANARLYTVNYQQDGLIPVCSQVKITDAGRKAVRFQVVNTGREYQYLLHRSLPAAFNEHLSEVFGKQCPQGRIATLSRVDQQGIEQGTAKVGMTKEAVAIAMGRPPAHETPSLESDQWMYWLHRFNRLRVEFENGKVSNIVR